MKTAVTLCRVAEASAGPFVFHDALANGFAKAAGHGFDAVELFLPSVDPDSVADIQRLQARHGLQIAAVGTGAGMVKHGLSLTDADPAVRRKAIDFILTFIGFGGQLGAPAILGSMQGRSNGAVPRGAAVGYLADALEIFSARAAAHGTRFIYEPLNRYETNLFNRIGDAAAFLADRRLENMTLLADFFHMNIEEASLERAIADNIAHVGHIHFADSNRRAMGFGHTDYKPLLRLLHQIGYSGYLSAEILPLPSADDAAARFIQSTRL